jgi:hypothetical protein
MSDFTEGQIAQWIWKSPVLQTLCVSISDHALRLDTFWPDELHLDVAGNDKNTIGTAYRTLIRFGILNHTGQYRPSKSDGANGRVIFQCTVKKPNLARALIRRFGGVAYTPQSEMTFA